VKEHEVYSVRKQPRFRASLHDFRIRAQPAFPGNDRLGIAGDGRGPAVSRLQLLSRRQACF
jgi:hypothetical protein